jgi:hypothetical protein
MIYRADLKGLYKPVLFFYIDFNKKLEGCSQHKQTE